MSRPRSAMRSGKPLADTPYGNASCDPCGVAQKSADLDGAMRAGRHRREGRMFNLSAELCIGGQLHWGWLAGIVMVSFFLGCLVSELLDRL